MFNTDADSVKGRDLARDPRVSICVDDDSSTAGSSNSCRRRKKRWSAA
ncbi:pyridoxamine 5'-phosphate oxidase family protein [Microtetraspora sp. AC03309]|nr:pyridoxamine 5'-phosphate oxidase family protein [Microtetraspora sp. AC03309]